MVWTVPQNRASEHKSWHVFYRGLCMYCGWYCDDCPNDVTTCKCKVTAEEKADALLKAENAGVSDSWREG